MLASELAPGRFQPGTIPVEAPPESLYLVYHGDRLLTDMRAPEPVPLHRDLLDTLELAPDSTHFLGYWDNRPCYAASYRASPPFDAMRFSLGNLYQLLGRVPEELFALAGRGLQVVGWFQDNQYCGRCGAPMERHPVDRAMSCRPCRNLVYPRLTPAVIVLVTRGHEMLLARNHNFPEGMYSTLAGFLEPGETAEQCVYREVLEESGIKVRDVRYFGTQSWPFPSQLMIGFFAEFESGDIVPEEGEIADAQWFTADSMPMTPPRHAISGQLIEAFLAGQG